MYILALIGLGERKILSTHLFQKLWKIFCELIIYYVLFYVAASFFKTDKFSIVKASEK